MKKMLWSVAMGVVLFAALGVFGTAIGGPKRNCRHLGGQVPDDDQRGNGITSGVKTTGS